MPAEATARGGRAARTVHEAGPTPVRARPATEAQEPAHRRTGAPARPRLERRTPRGQPIPVQRPEARRVREGAPRAPPGDARRRDRTARTRRARPTFARPPPARPARAGAPQPASSPGPTDPALRANPSPEVTDPACRLPLPTLFYRPEAVHLGDRLRLSVRPEATVHARPPHFQGPAGARRTPPETRRSTGPQPLAPDKPIPGIPPLTKKRKLFPGPRPASAGSLALQLGPPRRRRAPPPGSGILTRFPFGPGSEAPARMERGARLRSERNFPGA